MSSSPAGIETSVPKTSLYANAKDRLDRFLRSDWAGLHFSANIFIATTLLWLTLRKFAVGVGWIAFEAIDGARLLPV